MSYFEVQSPKRAAKIRLDASFFVIGRGERIPIFHDDPSISREHAAIVVRKTGLVRVRDLGSKNGVLRNGELIGRYAEIDLAYGDTLRIGGTTLVLREGEPPPREAAARKAPEAEKPAANRAEATPAPAPAPPARALPDGTVPLDELAAGLAPEREQLAALNRPAPPPAAESAAQAAASAAQAAESAALAASAAAAALGTGEIAIRELAEGDTVDLSRQEGDGGEPPPELLSSDEDDAPLELA
jgi:pSer/pThr/pTyr-binding forkhead associated (FHA) protein